MSTADPFALTPERITATLEWLRAEWGDRVPQYVCDWNHWDEDQKLSFVVEAGLREDYFHEAQGWGRNGLLLPSELAELHSIEELVAKNRPLLQPLLDED